MSVERIDSIYDIAALQAEQEKYISFLRESKQAIIDLNNLRITSKGSDLASFTKATTELNNAINNSSTATEKAIASKKALTRAELEARLANQQRTAALKNEIIENKAAAGSYDQLQAQLKRLQTEYKALGAAQRQSAEGAGLKNAINATKNQLKSLDSGIGDHQRNVGNYAKSIGGYFDNAAKRIVAYGAAYLGLNAIKDFFTSSISEALEAEKANIRFKATLDNLGRSDAFDRLTQKAKDLASQFQYLDNDEITGVFEKLVTYGKLSENQINQLTPVIINFAAKTGLPLQEASGVIIKALEGNGKALKEYGISIKDAKTDSERFAVVMNDLGNKVQGAADAFGETTTGKIATTQQRFKDLKEEIGTGLLPVLNKLLEGTNGLLKGFQKMGEDGIGRVIERTFTGFSIYMIKGADALKKFQDEMQGVGAATAEEKKKTVDTLYQLGHINTPQQGYGLGQVVPDLNKPFGAGGSGDDVKAHLDELKELTNNEFEIYKVHQDRKIHLFDEDVKSDKTHYLDKLVALNHFVDASKELLEREEQEDIENKRRAATREKQRLEQSKEDKNPAEIARINENIKRVEKNLQSDILLIQVQYADKRIGLVENAAKTRQDITDKYNKTEEQKESDHLQTMEDLEKKHLDRVQQQLDETARKQKEQFDKEREEQERMMDARFELAEKGEDFLFALATAGFERRLNLIQDEKDAIDKRKDAELAANEASTLSAEQKAANVAIINSRAQAQKEALDRQAREVELRKAKFERAQQIFAVSIDAIKTIAKLKFEALLNPFAASLIPFALASAALSIGAILAQPLPKYKTGRGEGKEEFALVHGGEYIKRDGGIEKVSAVETLTHLMPKDKVLPNKQALMKELALSGLSNFVVAKDGSISKADVENMTARIENAISDISFNHTTITKEGWRTHNQRLSDYDRWVDKYIKN